MGEAENELRDVPRRIAQEGVPTMGVAYCGIERLHNRKDHPWPPKKHAFRPAKMFVIGLT